MTDQTRWVSKRTSYLTRTTKLTDSEAEALAWSECGYSSSGIAGQMDTSQSTVKSYLKSIEALYGLEATVGRSDDTDHSLNEKSVQYAADCPEWFLDEWTQLVCDEARTERAVKEAFC
jgi:DNA-binding CsgD family transcriptional regulator